MTSTIDRRSGIGASEVYDVVEGNRLLIWRKKVEGYEQEDLPHLKRGRRLERTVLEMYRERLHEEGGDDLAIPDPQQTLKHPSCQVLFATPDAFFIPEGTEEAGNAIFVGPGCGVVDAKTSAVWKGWGEEGTAEVPNKILFQVLTQMACVELDTGMVATLMPSHELRVYQILRDRETEGLLIEKVERFWRDYIVTKKPPLEYIDGSDDWMDWLNQRYPQETKNYLQAEVGSDLELQCLALQVLQDRQKLNAEHVDFTKNLIRHLIGEHSGVSGSFGRIDYKKPKDSEKTDYKAVVQAALKEWKGFSKMRKGLECLESLIKQYTQSKPGVRSLHPYWKGSQEE